MHSPFERQIKTIEKQGKKSWSFKSLKPNVWKLKIKDVFPHNTLTIKDKNELGKIKEI